MKTIHENKADVLKRCLQIGNPHATHAYGHHKKPHSYSQRNNRESENRYLSYGKTIQKPAVIK